MLNLTNSKLRAKLFDYYFSQPECDLYVREAARIIKEDPSNLLREFKRLENDGIFVSKKRGKQKHFKLNKNYLFFNELKKMVTATIGIESKLIKVINKVDGIKLCFIYGSYASGKEKAGSDIDIFIIGSIKTDVLLDEINILEKAINREVNYRIFSEHDFNRRQKQKNSFIANVLSNKKIFLKGNERYFKKNF